VSAPLTHQSRAGLQHDTGIKDGAPSRTLRPGRRRAAARGWGAMGALLQFVGKGPDHQIATEAHRGPVWCSLRQASRSSCVDRSTNSAMASSSSAIARGRGLLFPRRCRDGTMARQNAGEPERRGLEGSLRSPARRCGKPAALFFGRGEGQPSFFFSVPEKTPRTV